MHPVAWALTPERCRPGQLVSPVCVSVAARLRGPALPCAQACSHMMRAFRKRPQNRGFGRACAVVLFRRSYAELKTYETSNLETLVIRDERFKISNIKDSVWIEYRILYYLTEY